MLYAIPTLLPTFSSGMVRRSSARVPPFFYLGTHHPSWLRKTDVPLFVSRRRLAGLKTLPRARGPWALDSGGFQELILHGEWTVSID